MNAPSRARMSRRQVGIVIALAIVLMLPLAWAGQWVVSKHIYLQNSLDDIAPRYARLKGLQERQQELQQALQQANAIKARLFYPSEQEPVQLGNSVQNRLRALMVKAGLGIASSQVKVDGPAAGAQAQAGQETIQILMAAEGTLSQIQLALISLREVQPPLLVQELQIGVRGSVMNANTKTEPVLSVRLLLIVPRSQGEV